MRQTLTDKRDRPLKQVSLQKRVELRKLYKAQTPRWRSPQTGYLASIPIVALGLLLLLFARMIFSNDFLFPGMPMVLAVLVVSLFWGVGPALFSVLLGAVALDNFAFPPVEQFDLTTTHGLIQILPFVVVGCIIAFITSQRESARMRALLAEEEAIQRADELEHVNQELEKANQLKDHFLSMAPHKLKITNSSIRGQVQLGMHRISKLAESPSELAPLRATLERTDQQTHRLNNLVDDLLDLCILRSGKLTLHYTRCDIGEMCRKVITEQRSLSGRTIDLEVASSPIALQADCERLSQVVSNLVTNACKYSLESSAIHMRVNQSDHSTMIQIYNEGSSISQEQLANIFEPFYRTPDAQSSSKNGWGLGLAISKQIVERHHGRIWVESSAEKGTTFTIELPFFLDEISPQRDEL